MEHIMIKIKSTQIPQGEEPEHIEFMTEGKYYLKNGARYIVYDESELSGMEGSTTTLKITEEGIKMKRYGGSKSELMFEKGKRYISDYITAYGHFKLEILTKELDWHIDEHHKGSIYVKYDLSMQGVMESLNTLEIELV